METLGHGVSEKEQLLSGHQRRHASQQPTVVGLGDIATFFTEMQWNSHESAMTLVVSEILHDAQ